MVRKSYIEQQIEALTAALAKVLALSGDKNYAGALVELRTACKRLTGMEIDTIAALPDATLVSLLTTGGTFDAGKGLTLAGLLGEQARLHALQGRVDAAETSRRKALALLLEALLQEEGLRTKRHQAQVDALTGELDQHRLPPFLQHRLFRYHETLGNYAKAEDALFALRAKQIPSSGAEAVSFYERLLAHPDAVLAAGGLPRDEVEEGLADAKKGSG